MANSFSTDLVLDKIAPRLVQFPDQELHLGKDPHAEATDLVPVDVLGMVLPHVLHPPLHVGQGEFLLRHVSGPQGRSGNYAGRPVSVASTPHRRRS